MRRQSSPNTQQSDLGENQTFIDCVDDFRSFEKRKKSQAWAAKKMGQRQDRERQIVVDAGRIQRIGTLPDEPSRTSWQCRATMKLAHHPPDVLEANLRNSSKQAVEAGRQRWEHSSKGRESE